MNKAKLIKQIKEMKLGGLQPYALGNDDAIRKVITLITKIK